MFSLFVTSKHLITAYVLHSNVGIVSFLILGMLTKLC